jgi:hypothetical protein
MKVIFVNWTKPFFERKNFAGYKKYSTFEYNGDDYFLPDYEIIMQMAAITSAKVRTGFPIKLVTDEIGKKYYEKVGLLELFDEVDTNTLETLNDEYDVNPAQFWTSGKIVSICKEEPPFLFMDLDLIIQDDFPKWVFDYDVVHTHWELPRSFLHIEQYMIDGMGLNIPTFDSRMLIPNTSFLFINNSDVLEEYLKLHLEIVTRKYEQVPDWLWLMSDQNILGYTMRSLNSKVTTFHNKTHVQFYDGMVDGVGYLPQWIDIPQTHNEKPVAFDHIWLDKSVVNNNEEFRLFKVEQWKQMIIGNGFNDELNKIIDKLN